MSFPIFDDLLVSITTSLLFQHQNSDFFEGKLHGGRSRIEVKKWDFPPLFQDGKITSWCLAPDRGLPISRL